MVSNGGSALLRLVRRTKPALRLLPGLIRLVRGDGLAGVRLALWTVRARRRVRRQLVQGGIPAVRLPGPPPGADPDVMNRVLRRDGASCLEAALVRQRWYAACRTSRTIVIGVTAPSGGFHAHAWLDGDTDAEQEGMLELLRHPVPEAWLS
ncbi:lasso peptide biosynthesis protein [Micromonospora sp. FIMYZ51]|uniref:lasso peptide biosynthesis protein n=1 Tax=Micromonospora sp. FIMYZ51 TaxID=3051832 RepID=UPI00311EE0E0